MLAFTPSLFMCRATVREGTLCRWWSPQAAHPVKPPMRRWRRSSKPPVTRIAWLCLCLVMLVPDLSFAQTQVQAPVVWNFLGPSGPAGPRSRVLSLAADPRNDSVVYAATPGGGLWKTQDGGGTWFPQLKGAPSLQVCSVAVDPRS